MKLITILLEAMMEQLPQTEGDIIEFPKDKFTISLDRAKSKLIFSPLQDESIPNKIRTMIQMLKQNFLILRVNSLEDEDDFGSEDDPRLKGVIEVELDPRQNFQEVVDFIKDQSGDKIK